MCTNVRGQEARFEEDNNLKRCCYIMFRVTSPRHRSYVVIRGDNTLRQMGIEPMTSYTCIYTHSHKSSSCALCVADNQVLGTISAFIGMILSLSLSLSLATAVGDPAY